jgi:hypothetical protein
MPVSTPTNQSLNRSINQSIDQPASQPASQLMLKIRISRKRSEMRMKTSAVSWLYGWQKEQQDFQPARRPYGAHPTGLADTTTGTDTAL